MTGNPFAPKMTEAQRQEAMRRYERGETLTHIAADYGISQPALGKTLRKLGLVIRKEAHNRLNFGPEIERKIVRDYTAGKNQQEIAKELGVSLRIPRRILAEKGVYQKRGLRPTTGWTKRTFKETLTRLANDLGHLPTTAEWYDHGYPSPSAFLYKWGKDWNRLVEEAGFVPVSKTGWTKEKLKRQFLMLLRQGKVLPLRLSVNQCGQLPSTGVIKARFGSFRAFLYDCGIEAISEHALCFQWEYCCEQIARHLFGKIVSQSLDTHVEGRPDIIVPDRRLIIDAMTSAYLDPQKKSEIRRYQNGYELEFWCLFRIGKEDPGIRYRYAEEMLEERGIPPIAKKIGLELLRTFRSPTYREELIAVLSRYHAETGKIPTAKQLRSIGAPTWAIYHREFGSFEKALELAGCPERQRHQRHTEEDLLQHLRSIHTQRGRPLSPKDLRSNGGINIRTSVNRFGSYEKTCARAGIPWRRLVIARRLSDDGTLQILREVHNSTRKPISCPRLRESKKIKTDTVQKHFGSIENACEQAGVPFQRLAKPHRSLREGTAR